MKNRTALMLGSAAVVMVVCAVTLLAWSLTHHTGSSTAKQAPAGPEAPEQVAARVVGRMWSFTYTDPGPNAWIEQVKPDVTPAAYAYWRQTYGPGDGPTTTPLWQQLEATEGHQLVSPGQVHTDPASAKTNTSTHLTLMVPYALDVVGVSTPLVDADHLFYVNLIRPDASAAWKVADVVAPQGLMPDYATQTLGPVPEVSK